jgi:Zn-dependent M16 (insulinase) family peptidase
MRKVIALLSLSCLLLLAGRGFADQALQELQPDQRIGDFKAESVYDNGTGKVIGARFRHVQSGCILDILRIQSVPQAYVWVNTPPPSDMGEPHTCEHLLLGKGNKGKYVPSLENMCLGSSSAGTYRLHTDYHFHTIAGGDVFYELFEAKLDAMINPNFTDEEIRREVCNMGVTESPEDGSLSLEEKGTVYTEMVSSFERPGSIMWRDLCLTVYGKDHPCANESGGTPEGIRRQTPRDLREFHDKAYTLSNMGMIVSIPDEYELSDFLIKMSEIFMRVEPDARRGPDPATANLRLPAPNPDHEGSRRRLEFPNQNENEPGILVFAWPPTLSLDVNEENMLNLFLANLSQGQTSNLYKKFYDSQTKVMGIGTGSVSGETMFDVGYPIYLWFSNVKRDALEDRVVDSIRAVVKSEISRIARFADGSDELKAFNDRVKNRLLEDQKDTRQFLSSPPRFGYRSIGNSWSEYLKHIQRKEGFRKDLTTPDEFDFVMGQLESGKNIWSDYIGRWGLLDVEPYTLTAVANPDILDRENESKRMRIDRFVETLKSQYGVTESPEAIEKYSEYYDEKTAEIEEEAKKVPMPAFVDSPPMTLDDQLKYDVENTPGGGEKLTSTFETMTGATAGLAFRMDVIPERYLQYVAALPLMISEVGVIEDGVPISYDEMRERMRQEILYAHASYSTSPTTDRVELVFTGSGSNEEESDNAIKWVKLLMTSPDWRFENLPRMRDAVDQRLASLRNTMKGREEYWVRDPATGYRKQDNHLLLRADCFLTQAHDVQRMRWMLRSADGAGTFEEFSNFIGLLVDQARTSSPEELSTMLSALGGGSAGNVPSGVQSSYDNLGTESRELVEDAIEDLLQNLNEIPDDSYQSDFSYVCNQMIKDLGVDPQTVLADLSDMMGLILKQDNVRSYVVSNSAVGNDISARLDATIASLSSGPTERHSYTSGPIVRSRLSERSPEEADAVYVGLLNENTKNGVVINNAGLAGFNDFDHDSILRYLAALVFSGGGGHSLFMKTWGAGLAYSNGVGANPSSGRLGYYAERCPDLAQTLKFVTDEIKHAELDESIVDYAIAQAFQASRSGSTYETRGRSMASDLADGLTPETVKRFREAVLEVSSMPNLYDTLSALMQDTYGRVLPGLGPDGEDVEDGVYFIIGPESQFETFEEYLRSTEGQGHVARLYPRDFWIPGTAMN